MKDSQSLSPFTLMLKNEFPDGVVKETSFQFGIDSIDGFLEEHGIKPTDHLIFDEVICTKFDKDFIHSILRMKNHVSSLWIAMGSEPVTGKNYFSQQ